MPVDCSIGWWIGLLAYQYIGFNCGVEDFDFSEVYECLDGQPVREMAPEFLSILTLGERVARDESYPATGSQ